MAQFTVMSITRLTLFHFLPSILSIDDVVFEGKNSNLKKDAAQHAPVKYEDFVGSGCLVCLAVDCHGFLK